MTSVTMATHLRSLVRCSRHCPCRSPVLAVALVVVAAAVDGGCVCSACCSTRGKRSTST